MLAGLGTTVAGSVVAALAEGFAPHQFLSDEEVLAAAAAGEITLVETDEGYLWAVVGAK